jgi:predicted nuclease of predicted toxin-antitoxin system
MPKSASQIRWLVDLDLPQMTLERPDVLPIYECDNDIMTEAIKKSRWIATRDRRFLEFYTESNSPPPMVIINGGFCPNESLIRNLLHFEFCLLRDNGNKLAQARRIFLMDLDKAVYRVGSDGFLEEIESWKTPSAKIRLN